MKWCDKIYDYSYLLTHVPGSKTSLHDHSLPRMKTPKVDPIIPHSDSDGSANVHCVYCSSLLGGGWRCNTPSTKGEYSSLISP